MHRKTTDPVEIQENEFPESDEIQKIKPDFESQSLQFWG